MSRQSDNTTPEREIVRAAQQQKEYIDSLSTYEKLSGHVARLLIGAAAGYAAYLWIVLGTPTRPVAVTSPKTPEQVREGLANFTALVAGAIGWGLCYIDWRSLWQWTVGATKQMLRRS